MSVSKYTYSWESFRTIDSYRTSFPADVERRRTAASNRIDFYKVGFNNWTMDFRNMPIIVMASLTQHTDTNTIRDLSHDILMCGSIGSHGKACPCGKHWYCQYDCWTKGKALTTRFPNLFTTPHTGFTKACFNPNINVDMNMCSEQDLKKLWESTEDWIRDMLNQQLIKGAYVCRELKINSYANHAFLPHSHILLAHDIHSPIVQPSGSGNWIPHHSLHTNYTNSINTEFKPIEDNRELFQYLRYFHKPIDLVEAYNTDILANPVDTTNHAVENSLNRFNFFIKGMQKCRGFGTMHFKSPYYIGQHTVPTT
jgi:hypothetical protein